MTFDELGPFDSVLDVGGNVGEFAEGCRQAWPLARITSFEPLPGAVRANEKRAAGRWWVEPVAIGDVRDSVLLHECVNQHSASTIMEPGTLRREAFGIRDTFRDVRVAVERLDSYLSWTHGRLLVKVDVEGAEALVLAGAASVLRSAEVVVVEVNQSPDIFVGSPSVAEVDAQLREHGLHFAGVLAVQADPAGRVVQFDGCWSR